MEKHAQKKYEEEDEEKTWIAANARPYKSFHDGRTDESDFE